jgi:hypothetical protein
VGNQLGRLGPLTGRQVFWSVEPTCREGMSLVGGDPRVPMSHSTTTISLNWEAFQGTGKPRHHVYTIQALLYSDPKQSNHNK